MTIQDVKDFCSEMFVGYEDMLNLTWLEYDYLQRGHNRRIEREWDVARNLMATMFNSSGFAKRKTNPRDIMELPLIDKKYKVFQRVDNETVRRLLKRMEDGQHN